MLMFLYGVVNNWVKIDYIFMAYIVYILEKID